MMGFEINKLNDALSIAVFFVLVSFRFHFLPSLSVRRNFSKLFLTNQNQTLYECSLGYPALDSICQKALPSLLKIEHSGQTVVFPMYLQNRLVLPNSDVCVQHDDIYLWSNFHFVQFSHVRVIALFRRFLLFLMLFLSKIFSSETT